MVPFMSLALTRCIHRHQSLPLTGMCFGCLRASPAGCGGPLVREPALFKRSTRRTPLPTDDGSIADRWNAFIVIPTSLTGDAGREQRHGRVPNPEAAKRLHCRSHRVRPVDITLTQVTFVSVNGGVTCRIKPRRGASGKCCSPPKPRKEESFAGVTPVSIPCPCGWGPCCKRRGRLGVCRLGPPARAFGAPREMTGRSRFRASTKYVQYR
jgi:hypothetical protein